jgi:hypothetical protein
MTKRIVRLATLAIVVAVVSTCDSGPKAGDLIVELVTPRPELGAAQFSVTATEPYTVDAVTAACAGCTAYTVRVSDREMRGIVTGTFTAGMLLFVTVPDLDGAEAYSFGLQEMAAPGFNLVSLEGSSLRLQQR